MASLSAIAVPETSCEHIPPCEPWNSPGHSTARVVSEHHDQCWCRLCNGVVVFDDGGEILPNGTVIPAHRPEPPTFLPQVGGVMSRIGELPAYVRRTILENAAEHQAENDEIGGTFYLSDLLADCGATTAMQLRDWEKLIRTIRLRDVLMPGSTDIPGGFESRAEADIQVENYQRAIDTYLLRLVPNELRAAS